MTYVFKRSSYLETAWLSEDKEILTVKLQGNEKRYHYEPKAGSQWTSASAFAQFLLLENRRESAGSFYSKVVKSEFAPVKQEAPEPECRLCQNGEPVEDGLCKSCFEIEAVDGEWQGRLVV